MVDDFVAQDENLRLAELRFKACRGDQTAAAALKKALIARKALPFYEMVAMELVSIAFPISIVFNVSRLRNHVFYVLLLA